MEKLMAWSLGLVFCMGRQVGSSTGSSGSNCIYIYRPCIFLAKVNWPSSHVAEVCVCVVRVHGCLWMLLYLYRSLSLFVL